MIRERKRKLWEIDHPFYVEEGNFYENHCHNTYDSWSSFVNDGIPFIDEDLNFLYRWDWKKMDQSDYFLDDLVSKESQKQVLKGYGRVSCVPDHLLLFYILPRKPKTISFEIQVEKEDEPVIRDWLKTKWEYMKTMWEPLS